MAGNPPKGADIRIGPVGGKEGGRAMESMIKLGSLGLADKKSCCCPAKEGEGGNPGLGSLKLVKTA